MILQDRLFTNKSLTGYCHLSNIISKSFDHLQGRKYLLRLINTSTASTFIFSIDKHILRVVSMDFVAIEPYVRTRMLGVTN